MSRRAAGRSRGCGSSTVRARKPVQKLGNQMPTIVIAAGGTAGHVVRALAVADELRASGARVVFAGTPNRAEAELVPRAGYEIVFLSVAGLDRRNPLRAGVAAVKAAAALPASLSLLRKV